MNHLNLFAPFESRDDHHEDVLTRNFLILVKNIPLVQVGFFELIRETLRPQEEIESIAQGQLKLSEIYTQVDSNSETMKSLSDVRMLSIIISDEQFQTTHSVKSSDRHARYDGVILCEPSWVFIIENKPSVNNIWEGQLDPNTSKMQDITLINTPCALSWRDIISLLNDLRSGNTLTPIEDTMIAEFLEYINKEYAWLNPYNRFDLCGTNKYLLDRRCCEIMDAYSETVEVKYHKGWKHYIDIGNECIQQFALDSEVYEHSWCINLWMYVGDTMRAARKTYTSLDIEKLLKLATRDTNYSFSTNFHFSFRSSGLVWLSCPLTLKEYLEYWKRIPNINQIKSDQFQAYYEELVRDQIIDDIDRAIFEEKILFKRYPNLNVCPGFLIKYTWQQNDALRLDKSNLFEQDFKRIILEVLDVFGIS